MNALSNVTKGAKTPHYGLLEDNESKLYTDLS